MSGVMALPVLPARLCGQVTRTPSDRANALIGRDYLSYSSLTTYQRCPLSFYFKYVARIPPAFRSSALLFGSAIHSAIEHHYRGLLEGEPTPSQKELLEAYDDAWSREADLPIRFGKNDNEGSLRALAARMLAVFREHELASPRDNPAILGIEEEFCGDIAPDCPRLLGRIDLLTDDRNVLGEPILAITDFKTSRSAWSASKIAESLPQQLLYARLVRPLADNAGYVGVAVRWLVITKAKSPRVDVHTATIDLAATQRVLNTAERIWRAIAAEHFYPTPSAMSCTTCPYQTACRNWHG